MTTNIVYFLRTFVIVSVITTLYYYANRPKKIKYDVPNFRVLIDCGHGGLDSLGVYQTKYAKQWKHESGSFHEGSTFYEGVYNRELGKRFAEKLADLGINYEFVSHKCLDIPMEERSAKANEIAKKYDCVLVSFHGNAGSGSTIETAKGLSVFVNADKDTVFANHLCKFLKNVKGTNLNVPSPNKLYWKDNLHMVREIKCPAVISEMGFFTRSKEAELMMESDFQEQVVDAHVKAVLAVLKKINS